MKKTNCPVCGGGSISLKKKTKTLTDSFGVKQEVEVNIYSCPDCGTEGDFFKENGAVIKKALRAVERQSAENIIKSLSEDGFKLSMIERVLGLSQRTLTKWKIGATQPSAPGVSLLKFIKVFPWLLDVADSNYDKNCAERILLEQFFCCTVSYNRVITAGNDKGFVAIMLKDPGQEVVSVSDDCNNILLTLAQ